MSIIKLDVTKKKMLSKKLTHTWVLPRGLCVMGNWVSIETANWCMISGSDSESCKHKQLDNEINTILHFHSFPVVGLKIGWTNLLNRHLS